MWVHSRWPWHCLIGLLCAFAALSCATTDLSQSHGVSSSPLGLRVSPILRFEDLPVPAGFALLSEESFAFQNDRSRVGVLKYEGKANVEPLISFYRTQMPMHGWGLVNILEFGRHWLQFEQSDETCSVMIERAGSKTLVTLAVAPRNAPSPRSLSKERDLSAPKTRER